jgi:hypothetical protein
VTGVRPGTRPATGPRLAAPRRRHIPRFRDAQAFPAVIAVFLAVVSQTAVPSPFYPRYESEFGLAPVELTIVFAAYVAGMVVTLLTVGSLSDYTGRRPVLAASCVIGVAATAMFLTANGFASLVIGRVLEGVSIGTGNAALAAALVDFAPRGNIRLASILAGALPPTALCLGALVAGICLQTSSRPVVVAYGASLIAILIGLVLTCALPEGHPRRRGALASLRPRIGVPRAARRAFAAVAGALVSGWALAGLYLALIPSVLQEAWPHADALIRVLPLSEFLAFAALAGVVLARIPDRLATYTALLALLAGTAAVGAALAVHGVPAAMLAPGTAVAGVGFGGTFQSSLRYLIDAIGPHERATVMAAALTLAFTAFGLPSIAAGAAIPAFGVLAVALVYTIGVIAVGAATLITFRQISGRTSDGRGLP